MVGLQLSFVLLVLIMLANTASAAPPPAAALVDLSKELEVDGAAVTSSPGALAVNEFAANNSLLRTMTVLEDGKVVAKYVRDDVDENEPYPVNSVTKSWTSLIIGMLIDEGKLSLNTTLGSMFRNESTWEGMDEVEFRKAVTIEGMVSMTSGLINNLNFSSSHSFESPISEEIARPTVGEKGAFSYLGASDILGFVILEVSGLTPRQYLAQNILPSLGIDDRDIEWLQSKSNGMEGVFGALWLTPNQMAKFGQLYLQGGKAGPLNSSRVVSEEWVDKSWTVFSEGVNPAHSSLTPHGLTKEQINEAFPVLDHGFLWYRRRFDDALWCADGHGGQHICVAPSLGRVVVSQRDADASVMADMLATGGDIADILLALIAEEGAFTRQVSKIAADDSLSFKAEGSTPTDGDGTDSSDKSLATSMMLGATVYVLAVMLGVLY